MGAAHRNAAAGARPWRCIHGCCPGAAAILAAVALMRWAVSPLGTRRARWARLTGAPSHYAAARARANRCPDNRATAGESNAPRRGLAAARRWS